jgi:hypothetical protein
MTLVSLHRASVVGATGGEFAQAASVKVSSKAAVSFIGLLPKFRLFLKCSALISSLATLLPFSQASRAMLMPDRTGTSFSSNSAQIT